ncbi:hypothetical protein RXV86_20550 [Alisedimentitalea sp. MJ-SS2]|uniref:hypothetical protein n=1 Tax=Aliisedimentitalea sp. MJ-SS2 TaxID=3049795 RepID=UPI002907A961|nr:hypothetical protein [Alisedimentitalea sp. MJ-SS2]MDU8929784.1 hypothetical protein [Alisedimentitalea sp. MJ-SS2]
MKNVIGLLVVSSLALSACAGRKPNPVEIVQDGDAKLSCKELRQEISVNNAAILKLVDEKKKKQGDNVAAGVVGGLIFFPALFFMDVKGAAGEEARAYQRRNEGLLKRYEHRRCSPKIIVASPEEIEAAKAKEDDE